MIMFENGSVVGEDCGSMKCCVLPRDVNWRFLQEKEAPTFTVPPEYELNDL